MSRLLPYSVLALAALCAALLAGTAIGESDLAPSVVYQVLANHLWQAGYPVDPIDAGIVWNYRLTRTLVAAACGAGLATCGVILQALLRNPLAEPYLLGLSAGASTGAVLVGLLGLGSVALSMSGGAFIGALAAFALVLVLARAAGPSNNNAQVILAGIAGSQLFTALTAFLITKSATAEQARGILFWLLGNLSGVRWPSVWLALPVALFGPVASPRTGCLHLRHRFGGVTGDPGAAYPIAVDQLRRAGDRSDGVHRRRHRFGRAGDPPRPALAARPRA